MLIFHINCIHKKRFGRPVAVSCTPEHVVTTDVEGTFGALAQKINRVDLGETAPFSWWSWMVGGAITILKNMSSSMGRMTSQMNSCSFIFNPGVNIRNDAGNPVTFPVKTTRSYAILRGGKSSHCRFEGSSHLSNWLVASTPLKKIFVSWDHCSKYMEKEKMFQSTNQVTIW